MNFVNYNCSNVFEWYIETFPSPLDPALHESPLLLLTPNPPFTPPDPALYQGALLLLMPNPPWNSFLDVTFWQQPKKNDLRTETVYLEKWIYVYV